MKLVQFNGGLSTRLAPHLIDQAQGVVYENIDNSLGVLSPDKSVSLSGGITTSKFAKYFEAEDVWLSSDTRKDYLEYQGMMLVSDRVNRPQRYEDGSYSFLGIKPPTVKPTLSNINSIPTISGVTVKNVDTVGDLPGGTLHYLIVSTNGTGYTIPYMITVNESGNTFTSANGDFDPDWTYKEVEPDTEVDTTETPLNRSVRFSQFEGRQGYDLYIYRYYNGVWREVAYVIPLVGIVTDSTYDISGNTALDSSKITKFNGTYQYVYTYYNSTKGIESGPSPVSNEIDVSSGYIRVSNLQVSTDTQVDKIRIYRVGNNITEFTLIEEINQTTQYNDQLKDTELDGFLLETDIYNEAPAGLKYLTESYAMIFGALGSTLRFTPIGVPWAWPEEYALEFYSTITGIGAVAAGILVFTEDKAHIVTGTGPTSLAQQSLRGDQGCISQESIQEVAGGSIIWASKDGLCTSSGNNVISLTKSLLGKLNLDPIDSAVYNEVYYILDSDKSLLVWDYRFSKPIAKILTLDIESLAKGKGSLYGWKEDKLREFFTGDDLTFKYKSPVFTEGSYSGAKTYKKVYIRSKGDIIINIIIDENLIATRNLSGMDTHQLQVPQDKQRGYSIQFEVEGTGTLYEIEYIVGVRKDG